jgi:hypothetical protein
VPRCAQCGGEYHSLHTQCLVIQQYCSDLKENVTRALASGKLHRNEYTNQQLAVTVKNQDFPPLGKSIIPQHSAWNRVQTETRTNDASDTTKSLLLINENPVAMRESTRRVEENLRRLISNRIKQR